MADGSKSDETGVLGSLPATRPARLSRRNAERPQPGTRKPAAAKATVKPRVAAAKPKTTAKPKRVAPKPEPVSVKPNKPRAVRAGSPGLKDAITPSARPTNEPPSGTELVSTVFRAAGEVAQIGLTVGGQILKRAAGRLPKP